MYNRNRVRDQRQDRLSEVEVGERLINCTETQAMVMRQPDTRGMAAKPTWSNRNPPIAAPIPAPPYMPLIPNDAASIARSGSAAIRLACMAGLSAHANTDQQAISIKNAIP